MASRSADHKNSNSSGGLQFLIGLILLVGILYVAKPVLLPLSLAVLLTFVLTPLVVAVQTWGVSRVPAAIAVVLFTLLVCAGIGWGVGSQLSRLADALPAHSGEIKAKIEKLRSNGAGPFSRMLESLNQIGQAPHKQTTEYEATPQPQVVVAQPQSSALDRLESIASTVLPMVADAALILILVIFMLIRREDLRNRIIGLLGHGRLTGTTRVFVESANRISQLLLMQLVVNASFGLVFSLALLAIGVPYWLLWGFLTALLRFVPFVGTWIAAALPVLLSFAISPGWAQPVLVLSVFAVLDLVTANVLEPLLFGHRTGVSPVALLIAAVFWTWIWGPIGLVLSTPLTVCLVVMGQHVPRLGFLNLLLGQEAPLAPHVAFYQRLLAGDQAEAHQIASHFARDFGLQRAADEVLIPSLRMTRRDRLEAGLSAKDETLVLDAIDKIIASLVEHPAPTLQNPTGPIRTATTLVMGHPAHHRADESVLTLLAGVVADHGVMEVVSTRTLPAELETRVALEKPDVVFIAVLPPGGISQARYLCARLHKAHPTLNIVVGYFGRVRNFDNLLVKFRARGASYLTTSIEQSRTQICALLAPPLSPAPVPELRPNASLPKVVSA